MSNTNMSSAQKPYVLNSKTVVLGDERFSIYLLGSPGFRIMVECGVGAVTDTVVGQVESLGVDPLEIKALVAAHAHFDHTAGAWHFKRVWPHLEIWAAAQTAKVLSHPDIIKKFAKEDQYVSSHYQKKGLVDRPPTAAFPEKINVDRIITPGDPLEIGSDYSLIPIDAPGHCPGGTAFFAPESSLLLVSDSLGFLLSPRELFPLYFVDFHDYLKTIQNLREYAPRILGPAHQGLFENPREISDLFDLSKRTTEEIHRGILSDHRAGKSGEAIRKSIFQRYYRDGLTMYAPENIRLCAKLLYRRSLEAEGLSAEV